VEYPQLGKKKPLKLPWTGNTAALAILVAKRRILMSVTKLQLPRPVHDMCADLAGQGFDLLNEQQGAGGQLLELQGPVKAGAQWVEASVRVSAEHGHWSISVRFEHMSRWIWAQAWEAYLDGVELGEPDVHRQSAFVRNRLADAALAIYTEAAAERELIRLTDGYLRQRLGLPLA
jgi:preprotein translocase subunit SecD